MSAATTWRRFTEQVEQRHGDGRYTVLLAEHPLYLAGYAPLRHKPRFGNLTLAPRIPLYQLGYMGAAPVGPSVTKAIAPIAVVASSMIATAAGAGSIAGPIGTAVGVVIGLIAGFWSAHDARAAGAKDENTVVNSAVIAFNQSLKAVFAAANSSDPAQNITAAQAISACQQILQSYWAAMQGQMSGPGRSDASNGGQSCGTLETPPVCGEMASGGHLCNKSCTAGCCVGCNDLTNTIAMAIAVFQAGGGTVNVCQVYGDKYGLVDAASYSLTYTPPTVSGSAAGAVSSIESALTGNVSSSSLFLIGAAILAAMVFLR